MPDLGQTSVYRFVHHCTQDADLTDRPICMTLNRELFTALFISVLKMLTLDTELFTALFTSVLKMLTLDRELFTALFTSVLKMLTLDRELFTALSN